MQRFAISIFFFFRDNTTRIKIHSKFTSLFISGLMSKRLTRVPILCMQRGWKYQTFFFVWNSSPSVQLIRNRGLRNENVVDNSKDCHTKISFEIRWNISAVQIHNDRSDLSDENINMPRWEKTVSHRTYHSCRKTPENIVHKQLSYFSC